MEWPGYANLRKRLVLTFSFPRSVYNFSRLFFAVGKGKLCMYFGSTLDEDYSQSLKQSQYIYTDICAYNVGWRGWGLGGGGGITTAKEVKRRQV